ncbi:MAG: DUF6088 family protein [Cyclobacteriaceae bacterium]
MQNIEKEILTKVKKAKGGALFFNDDFARMGSGDAVKKALSRLEKKEELTRVARGIYTRPKTSKLLGLPVLPGIQEVARAIAKRDRAKAIPTGAMALYQLGLSSQIPLNAVYLTDGSPRSVQIGKSRIVFKKTAPKNLAVQGEASLLVIQALKEIGREHVSGEQKKRVLEVLKKENPHKLNHDIRLAPAWIRPIMKEALNG